MLTPALATDLAILQLSGATIDDQGDHLVVRNPGNPAHHWGNFIAVTDPGAVDDADRWVTEFTSEFPRADWVAIGLPRVPSSLEAWAAHELEVEAIEALVARALPRQTPSVHDYEVRQFSGNDWHLQLARAIAENASTARHPVEEFTAYAQSRSLQRQALCRRGAAAWFGAFCDGELVADLGVVACGTIARYQDVSTDPGHRRRGLAGHLLGVAAAWAAARGCTEWVIVTEAGSHAGRVYRAAGFSPVAASAEAYRASRAPGPDPS